jgi:DNA invertase Pin-like site-specific DNA recombinase
MVAPQRDAEEVGGCRMPRELLVAYFRVGIGRQGFSELGLEAQHRAIGEYLDGGDRELIAQYTEIERGQRCARPELARALAACRRHGATLIIARLDRLARNASALFPIFDGIADCDVVFCDPPQAGRRQAGRLPAVRMAADEAGDDLPHRRGHAVWEASEASEEDTDWISPGFAERFKANRRTDAVARRLADERAANMLPVVRALQASGISTLQGMADALNARGIPTARGARWYPTTVRNLLARDAQTSRSAAA